MFITAIPEQLTALLKQGRSYTVPKGEVILSTDSKNKSLHMVANGFIKRYQIANNGNLSIQSIYGPNDIFPLTYVFRLIFGKEIYSGPETYFYEAMSRTSLYSIDDETLMEAVASDPMLYGDLLLVAGDRFQSNIQQLENMSLSVYYKRVAHQLWFFANKFSESGVTGTKISLPFTQQDLADILSTTRETVSLCMTQLKNKGLIKSGRFVVIPDVEKLKEEAFS